MDWHHGSSLIFQMTKTQFFIFGSRCNYDIGFLIFVDTLRIIGANLMVVYLHEYLTLILPSIF
jgi:hypothetical protein